MWGVVSVACHPRALGVWPLGAPGEEHHNVVTEAGASHWRPGPGARSLSQGVRPGDKHHIHHCASGLPGEDILVQHQVLVKFNFVLVIELIK